MEFPLAAEFAARLIVLDEVASTNDEHSSRAAKDSLPEFTVVSTTTQTAGRGRMGRTWEAPAGTSLAVSVLLRPQHSVMGGDHYGWVPLIAGLAMARAVGRLVVDRGVSLKWPNDVLIDGKKVSGLLCELLADGTVVVGSGVNLTIPENALPVSHATSLMLAGVSGAAEELADLVLSNYLAELTRLWHEFTAADDSDRVRDIRTAVSASCSTLGKPVRLSLPDGTEDFGTALDLDDDGRLRVRMDSDDRVQAVAAGDVTHLRYE